MNINHFILNLCFTINLTIIDGASDNPPPLPPRRQNNKPPEKPERTSVIYEENKPFPKEVKSPTGSIFNKNKVSLVILVNN